jgi:SAM-dependent methyltransferase
MSDIKLNVGCGGHYMRGYIGIDLYYRRGVNVIAAADRLPFLANCASHVYTQHLVEHLAPKVFNFAITDWHRVLKSGGKLTIRCPNFEYWTRRWLDAPDSERWPNLVNSIIGNANKGDGHLTRNAFIPNRLQMVVNGPLFTVTDYHSMPSRIGVEGADCYCEAIAK